MICTNCNNDLDEDQFAWKSKSKGTKNKECKQCHRDYSKQHYQVEILRYLVDHPCVDCGETDPVVLEFDHVSPVLKARVTSLVRCSWEQIRKEIEQCEVRCANCHRRVTHKRSGSFRVKFIYDLE